MDETRVALSLLRQAHEDLHLVVLDIDLKAKQAIAQDRDPKPANARALLAAEKLTELARELRALGVTL